MGLSIDFLPDRLNREPVVFRGLTTTELFLALSVGLVVGALLGSFPAITLGIWALIPSGAVGGGALLVLTGGRYMARLKRGRPDTWLYRSIDAWFSRHGVGSAELVQRSAVWSVRRRAL